MRELEAQVATLEKEQIAMKSDRMALESQFEQNLTQALSERDEMKTRVQTQAEVSSAALAAAQTESAVARQGADEAAGMVTRLQTQVSALELTAHEEKTRAERLHEKVNGLERDVSAANSSAAQRAAEVTALTSKLQDAKVPNPNPNPNPNSNPNPKPNQLSP